MYVYVLGMSFCTIPAKNKSDIYIYMYIYISTPTPLEQEADLPTPTPLEPTVIVADTPTTTEIKPKTGDFVTVAYGRRWYVAKVVGFEGKLMSISYMKPTRGKWRWGQEDQGEVNSDDILMIVLHQQNSETSTMSRQQKRKYPRRSSRI